MLETEKLSLNSKPETT